MHRYRRVLNWLLVMAGCGLVMTAAPSDADAAFRLGGDVIWVPVAANSVQVGNTEFDSQHQIDSYGGAIHGNIGFDIFSLGLKLNYFNEGVELASTTERREEVDINAMGRLGVPATSLGIFGEAGVSFNPDSDSDGVGYNAGLGAEYSIFSMAVVDFNLGVEGQYVNISESIGNQSATNESFRLMTFVGADFGL